jgi:hypothetical protein
VPRERKREREDEEANAGFKHELVVSIWLVQLSHATADCTTGGHTLQDGASSSRARLLWRDSVISVHVALHRPLFTRQPLVSHQVNWSELKGQDFKKCFGRFISKIIIKNQNRKKSGGLCRWWGACTPRQL